MLISMVTRSYRHLLDISFDFYALPKFIFVASFPFAYSHLLYSFFGFYIKNIQFFVKQSWHSGQYRISYTCDRKHATHDAAFSLPRSQRNTSIRIKIYDKYTLFYIILQIIKNEVFKKKYVHIKGTQKYAK